MLAAVAPASSKLGFPLLTALVFLPAAGAVVAMCVPRRRPEVVRAVGYVTTAAVFAAKRAPSSMAIGSAVFGGAAAYESAAQAA